MHRLMFRLNVIQALRPHVPIQKIIILTTIFICCVIVKAMQ